GLDVVRSGTRCTNAFAAPVPARIGAAANRRLLPARGGIFSATLDRQSEEPRCRSKSTCARLGTDVLVPRAIPPVERIDASSAGSTGTACLDRPYRRCVRNGRGLSAVVFPHAPKDRGRAGDRTGLPEGHLAAKIWECARDGFRAVQHSHTHAESPASPDSGVLSGNRICDHDPVPKNSACQGATLGRLSKWAGGSAQRGVVSL